MHKNIYWLILSIFIMIVVPWVGVNLVTSDAGMMTTILLFFVINPLYLIFIGMYAGKSIKTSWWLPVITSILFLIGAWIFFEIYELAFLLYCLIYLVIGIVSMFITGSINNKNH